MRAPPFPFATFMPTPNVDAVQSVSGKRGACPTAIPSAMDNRIRGNRSGTQLARPFAHECDPAILDSRCKLSSLRRAGPPKLRRDCGAALRVRDRARDDAPQWRAALCLRALR